MSTPLQSAYDKFIQKVDEDLTGKESLIFNYLKSAISKSYKRIPHSLAYEVNETTYVGTFTETLDEDEIELLSLWMLYDHRRRKESYLAALKREYGTKDFNSIPDKKRELDGIQNSMKTLKDEIKELQQEFNTFKYS